MSGSSRRMALAAAQRSVLAKEVGHHAVGRVLELQDLVDQFGGEFEQGVRVHRRIILGR